MLAGTVMVSGEKIYIFKLEFEKEERNFVQNQECFMMRKIQENWCRTLGTYSLINIRPIGKILEYSCFS